jgi:hypothetical protein
LNTAFTVSAAWSDDQAAGNAVLTATESGGAAGSIGSCTVASNSDSQTVAIANGSPSDTCTVGPDLDTVVEATSISVSYTCTARGQITFVLNEGGVASSSVVVNCDGAQAGNIAVTFSSNPACGAVSVRATVTGTNGQPAADGTLVSFSSNQGFFSPAQAATTGGFAITNFTPSAPFSTATITATALGLTGQNILQIACFNQNPFLFYDPGPAQYPFVTTQPAPVLQPAPQTPAQQPQAQQPVAVAPVQVPPSISPIAPPRTGDAGLLASD